MQDQTIQIDESTIQQWLSSGHSIEIVREELHNRGASEREIEEHLRAYKKAILDKRRFNATLLLGIGAFIGFVGCVMAMINPFPDMYSIFLYGTTSLAAIVAFGGLYLLLE